MANKNAQLQKIDHTVIRVSQVSLIILNLLAFVLDLPVVAVISSIFMFIGVLRRKPAYDFVYSMFIQPLKLAKPEVLLDNREPHQFAQLLGTVFTMLGSIFLMLGIPVLGWVLIWIVIALAALNVFGGFCVGCAMYYWLGRMKVSGFNKQPPPGTIPGKRPHG